MAAVNKNPNSRRVKMPCVGCRFGELWPPAGLGDSQLPQTEGVVEHNRPYRKGEHLYRQGDDFSRVYSVRSGSFKSYRLTRNHQRRVTGFYLPGDIIGVDGIAVRRYANSIEALEPSLVCKVAFAEMERLARQIHGLQRTFFAVVTGMADEVLREQDIHVLMGGYSAEARTAAFLLSLSSRYSAESSSSAHIRLPMTRSDIGEYLGLSVETVSRVLGKLQREKLIAVKGREIEILDADALYNFAISD